MSFRSVNKILNLSHQLREKGFNKQANELEYQFLILKKSETKLYSVFKETGKDLIDEAHPKGSVKVEDSSDELGFVETIDDQHQKMLKTLKDPTGKLANVVNLIQKEAAGNWFQNVVSEQASNVSKNPKLLSWMKENKIKSGMLAALLTYGLIGVAESIYQNNRQMTEQYCDEAIKFIGGLTKFEIPEIQKNTTIRAIRVIKGLLKKMTDYSTDPTKIPLEEAKQIVQLCRNVKKSLADADNSLGNFFKRLPGLDEKAASNYINNFIDAATEAENWAIMTHEELQRMDMGYSSGLGDDAGAGAGANAAAASVAPLTLPELIKLKKMTTTKADFGKDGTGQEWLDMYKAWENTDERFNKPGNIQAVRIILSNP
jgi:hypothetical protein